jgi:hypothetical protein
MPSTNDLIDQLTADLQPRRKTSPWAGRAVLGCVAALTMVVFVAAAHGMRADFIAGEPHSVPLISELVLLSALCAVAAAVTAMARPAVGALRGGWQWAVAALAVLPIAALMTAIGNASERAIMFPPEGPFCFFAGTLGSLASIVVLTIWLRRGAPTSPTRAAWMVGITGGAVGAIAIGLICPIDAVTHIGTWHVGAILFAALGSRLILPRFLRW